jgi:hypothetical protein
LISFLYKNEYQNLKPAETTIGKELKENKETTPTTPTTTGVGEDVGKKEPSYTVGGNVD